MLAMILDVSHFNFLLNFNYNHGKIKKNVKHLNVAYFFNKYQLSLIDPRDGIVL